MLAILFSLVHSAVAWEVSSWWPQVLALPPDDPRRVAFMIYWWPPMRMLGVVAAEAGAPAGGITNLMLLPLGWLTCFAYGWLTALALCLPFRFKKRR